MRLRSSGGRSMKGKICLLGRGRDTGDFVGAILRFFVNCLRVCFSHPAASTSLVSCLILVLASTIAVVLAMCLGVSTDAGRYHNIPGFSQNLGMQSHRTEKIIRHSRDAFRTLPRSCFIVCISHPAASRSLVSCWILALASTTAAALATCLGVSTESGVAG